MMLMSYHQGMGLELKERELLRVQLSTIRFSLRWILNVCNKQVRVCAMMMVI